MQIYLGKLTLEIRRGGIASANSDGLSPVALIDLLAEVLDFQSPWRLYRKIHQFFFKDCPAFLEDNRGSKQRRALFTDSVSGK